MHTIYMYVIHKRIGVIVSLAGVCFTLKKKLTDIINRIMSS